ncbi:MAG TPA: hypothetical protein VEY67_04055 [Candidatus Dormibacteraeota bacterium]|nr:hypothetical protein [Candidatus Dormibacteraeota bacterium]
MSEPLSDDADDLRHPMAPRAFHGGTGGGRGERRLGAVAPVLLVGFLGIAVAKPWGAPAQPDPAPSPAPTGAIAPSAPAPTEAPLVVPVFAVPSPRPLPVAFTTDAPPAPAAAWTALRWRRLAPTDPLALVTRILRTPAGSVAVGRQYGIPATPVWASADGRAWQPLLFDTGSTFWPGSAVLAVGRVPGGLVALTEVLDYCEALCPQTFILPVVSWTSPDGRSWTPHMLPTEWFASPSGSAPVVALGPNGILLASKGPGARLATSTDGRTYRAIGSLPEEFALADVAATSTGYVAGGRWTAGARPRPAVMTSVDGRRWSPPAILSTPAGLTSASAQVTRFMTAGEGVLAVGEAVGAAAPTLWWRSDGGSGWAPLDGYPPLGAWSSSGAAQRSGPHGLVAGDGSRLVAVRTGANAGAWVSSDARSWRRLAMLGAPPDVAITSLVLLPDGVLASDGSTTWFGEAAAG